MRALDVGPTAGPAGKKGKSIAALYMLTLEALAALTLSTVNVACRHWFENGDDTDVERAVERALAAVAEAGRRPRARRAR